MSKQAIKEYVKANFNDEEKVYLPYLLRWSIKEMNEYIYDG